MTSKRTITTAQRFGVWKACKGRCFWCREPVLFQACHIDHVIPLDAVSNPQDLAKVRDLFGLSPSFDFDGYYNWVAAHAECNQRKSFILPDPSPAFSLYLTSIRSMAPLAKETAEIIASNSRKANLMAKIGAAVESGDITEQDIRELLYSLPVFVQKSADPEIMSSEELFIAPGWKVKETRGHLISVLSEDGRFGMTSSSGHPSWICSRCGSAGPWNGVICLNCGNREEPD